MAIERMQSRANRLMAPETERRLVVTDSTKSANAPANVFVQHRGITAKGADYAANLVASRHAKNASVMQKRYADAHVAALIPAFDIMRPRG